jgi:hypothetical protein
VANLPARASVGPEVEGTGNFEAEVVVVFVVRMFAFAPNGRRTRETLALLVFMPLALARSTTWPPVRVDERDRMNFESFDLGSASRVKLLDLSANG